MSLRITLPLVACLFVFSHLVVFSQMTQSARADSSSEEIDGKCYVAEVTKNRVNLRKTAGYGKHDGVRANRGDRFVVRVVPAVKDWIRIVEGPHQGRHIHSGMVRIRLREDQEDCRKIQASAETGVDQLNVRETPSLSGKVVGKLGFADPLNVTPAEGEWLKILWPAEYEGKYVHRDMVLIQLPAAAE